MNQLMNINFKWRLSLIWLSLSLTLTLIMQAAPVQAQPLPAPVSRGYSLLERGWVNDAIAAFQDAVRRYPQSLEAKLGLATAYQRAGQDANAWTTYQQVLQQDPNNRQALTAVGTLGGYRSEWQSQGIAALTTLLNLNTNDNAARAQRALLLGYQGRFTEAIADYEIVLRSNPSSETILGAAQIYTYSGDYAQGLALFNRYQTNSRTIPTNAVTAYAAALRETGNVAEAIEILESRLQRSAQDATAIDMRTALAIAYAENQQSAAASAILEPLYGNAAARLPLARALSTIARQTGDQERYGEAVDLYRQVLAQTPNPSTGLVIETADVFSEYPAAQAEALRLYDQVLAQQPSPSLQVKRLVVASELGQLTRSQLRQELQSTLQSLPAAPAERRSLAQALVRLDPPDPALLSVYQNLQETVPFLNFRIAQMQIETGDFAGARQAIAAYAPSAPTDLAPELLLAEIDRREGNLAASAQRYEALITQNPTDAILNDALRGLAGVRVAQGQPEAALAVYDRLLAINPTDERAQLGRTSLAYQTGQLTLTEAESALDRWLQSNTNVTPPPELFELVGNLPADPQREALYTQLLAIEPDDIALNRRLVQILAARDPAEAQTVVNQFMERNSDNVNGYWLQGELAQTTGDLELASQTYSRLLERQPDNTDALSALAGVRFEQQRYAEARALYDRVLALKPNDPETRRILADLSLVQDQPLSALRELRQLQQQSETPNAAIDQRIEQTRVDLLRRRGFQPSWERY